MFLFKISDETKAEEKTLIKTIHKTSLYNELLLSNNLNIYEI